MLPNPGHSAPIALPTKPCGLSGGNPGAVSRKDSSEVAHSFYALNKRTHVYLTEPGQESSRRQQGHAPAYLSSKHREVSGLDPFLFIRWSLSEAVGTTQSLWGDV